MMSLSVLYFHACQEHTLLSFSSDVSRNHSFSSNCEGNTPSKSSTRIGFLGFLEEKKDWREANILVPFANWSQCSAVRSQQHFTFQFHWQIEALKSFWLIAAWQSKTEYCNLNRVGVLMHASIKLWNRLEAMPTLEQKYKNQFWQGHVCSQVKPLDPFGSYFLFLGVYFALCYCSRQLWRVCEFVRKGSRE